MAEHIVEVRDDTIEAEWLDAHRSLATDLAYPAITIRFMRPAS